VEKLELLLPTLPRCYTRVTRRKARVEKCHVLASSLWYLISDFLHDWTISILGKACEPLLDILKQQIGNRVLDRGQMPSIVPMISKHARINISSRFGPFVCDIRLECRLQRCIRELCSLAAIVKTPSNVPIAVWKDGEVVFGLAV
jgi:hypothetical protein